MIIKLTDRLQLIADEIKKGETMADIGTDHGFLPLYLWQNEISPEVVMCDISEPSLQKARDAAAQLLSDGEMLPDPSGKGLKFRAGDGLKILALGEVDCVAIAGMGGVLISEILGEDMGKTLSFKKYVMQPRNHSGWLRYWLASKGFVIEAEHLVREGKYICDIITAISPDAPVDTIPEFGEEDPRWDVPDMMAGEALFEDFARVRLERETKVLRGMQKGSDVPEEDIARCQMRVDYFAGLIK